MSKQQFIECLDKILQDINDCNTLFGGDFRQVAPIVPNEQRKKLLMQVF